MTDSTFPKNLKLNQQRAVGVENELFTKNQRRKYRFQMLSNSDFRKLAGQVGKEQHPDCGAIEFTTRPMRLSYLKSKTGKEQLEQYYQRLQNETRISRTNGSHVHISILETDNDLLVERVLVIATQFYPQIQKIAGRQSINWAASPNLQNMEAAKDNTSRRKCNKNGTKTGPYIRSFHIITPTAHKTLEFRGPKGSNDPMEIMAWIEFMENIVRVANRKKLKTLKFSELLKGQYISQYASKLRDWRYIAKRDKEEKITKGLY